MLDLIFVVVAIAFFVLSLGYVEFCPDTPDKYSVIHKAVLVRIHREPPVIEFYGKEILPRVKHG
jgi:hypothetical protein